MRIYADARVIVALHVRCSFEKGDEVEARIKAYIDHQIASGKARKVMGNDRQATVDTGTLFMGEHRQQIEVSCMVRRHKVPAAAQWLQTCMVTCINQEER